MHIILHGMHEPQVGPSCVCRISDGEAVVIATIATTMVVHCGPVQADTSNIYL